MFKVNNKDIINFENISHLVLVFLLLTLSRQITVGKGQCQKWTFRTFSSVNNEAFCEIS